MRILVSAKCDPNRANLNGDTSLHIACAMGRRKLTRILLESGSEKNITNAQGETARDIAIRKKMKEIICILDKVSLVQSPQDPSSSSKEVMKHKDNKKRKSSRKSEDKVDNVKELPDPRHWSPYGCHYSPDPKNFPSPKLETLPKEPLRKGEQYYLDLAGNIRKGPVGVGTACYCAPFFRHLEHRITKSKKHLRKYVEQIDHKVDALANKTDDQIEGLTKSIIADRIRCEDKKLYLRSWLKRGVLQRASLAPGKISAKEYELNTGTLTRSRSLEIVDADEPIFKGDIKTSTPAGLSRSVDLLNCHNVTVHREDEMSDLRPESSLNSNAKNHPESDREKNSTFMSSDKEHAHSYRKESSVEKSSSHPSDSRRTSKFKISKEPKSYKYKLKEHKKEDHKYEDDSLNNSDIESAKYNDDLHTSLVTKRLEKLLLETKNMLEKEKVFQKLRKKDELYLTPDNYIKKLRTGHMLSRDRLIEHLEATQLKSFDDRTRNIEKEMEFITKTLCDRSSVREFREFSKEKELPVDSQKNTNKNNNHCESGSEEEDDDINLSDANEELVDDINEIAGHTNYTVSTKFSKNIQEPESSNEDADSQVEVETAEQINRQMMNGFFTNAEFAETRHQSSSSSQQSPATVRETPDICRTSSSGDNRSMKTSEYTNALNIKELNELKNRILNGTNWRSNVLKKSADEVRSYSESPELQRFNVDQNRFYDVKSSEVKQVKLLDDPKQLHSSIDTVDNAKGPVLPAKGLVKRLISKIQSTSKSQSVLDATDNSQPGGSEVSNLVPKDAYFHELPRKPLPIAVARNRNPLPIDLNENDILQEPQNIFLPPKEFYSASTTPNHTAIVMNHRLTGQLSTPTLIPYIQERTVLSPTNDSGYNSTRLCDSNLSDSQNKFNMVPNSQMHHEIYHNPNNDNNTHIDTNDSNKNNDRNSNHILGKTEYYLTNNNVGASSLV